MLYPTITELTRGTAHPESQASQTVLVALSAGLEASVVTTRRIPESATSHGDFRRQPNAPVRLARRDEGSGSGQRSGDASGPARWRSQQAA